MSKIIYDYPKTHGKRLTTEAFIKRAKKVHGSKYDYSKVNYQGTQHKVTIICPIHGEFQQTPNSHVSGRGCRKCGLILQGRSYQKSCSKKYNIKWFIKRAKEVHGNKYNYSKTKYTNLQSKIAIAIICPEHGEFEQRPSSHLKGHGCPMCRPKAKSTTEHFIKKAQKIHGLKYDYSKVDYKNARANVTIICPIHGEFQQTPNNHLKPRTCPKCGKLRSGGQGFDRAIDPHPGFLYFLTCKLGNDYFCKIGTAYDTKRRFRAFPFEIVDSIIIPGIIGPLSVIEEKVKNDFKEFQYIPKVKFAGSRKECFSLEAYPKILKYIKKAS